MERLFNITPSIRCYPERGQLTVQISSVEAVRHLQSLGLVIGNKVSQQAAIPEWIFEDIELARACTRGLMDTDGCVYHHAYKVNGKEYSYVKMTFTSHSKPLLHGMQRMLLLLGLHPGAIRGSRVSLSSGEEVILCNEQLVGVSNSYHWRRYQEALAERAKRWT